MKSLYDMTCAARATAPGSISRSAASTGRVQPCCRTEPERAKISDMIPGRPASIRSSRSWLRLSSQLMPGRTGVPSRSRSHAPTIAPVTPIARTAPFGSPLAATTSASTCTAAIQHASGSASTQPGRGRESGVRRDATAISRPVRSKQAALTTEDPASMPIKHSVKTASLCQGPR